MSERILIRNADAVVTCDPADRVLYNSDILICGNRIEAVGSNLAAGDAQIIDAAGKYVYPGLVNTHHHFFQAFVRNLMTIDRSELTLMQWLDEMEQHEDVAVRGGVKLTREYVQYLKDEIGRLRHENEVKNAYLKKLREKVPGLVLRTSLITGLPGEGEEEFAQLCQFLKRAKLERVGAFPFSPEEGTPAAAMEHPDAETAQARAEIIEELQSRIMDQYNESLLGKTLEVLCDGYDPEEGRYYGSTYADSPDIDGKVWFTASSPVKTGSFCQVRITGVQDGELVGQEGMA